MTKNKEFKQPTIEKVQEAFNNAGNNPEIQKLLRDLYGDVVEPEDNRPITERVKTLEDAIAVLGDEHPYVKHLTSYMEEMHGNEEQMDDIAAFLKLRIITAALNEGWTPDWGNTSEYKYFPWFIIYTKEEIEQMDEEEKSRVVGRANFSADAYGGLVYAHASSASSNSYTNYGSRLAFKTSDLAKYAGTQFGDIYADYLI